MCLERREELNCSCTRENSVPACHHFISTLHIHCIVSYGWGPTSKAPSSGTWRTGCFYIIPEVLNWILAPPATTAILISTQSKFHYIRESLCKNLSRQLKKKKKERVVMVAGTLHVVLSFQVFAEECRKYYYNISYHLKGTSLPKSSCNRSNK